MKTKLTISFIFLYILSVTAQETVLKLPNLMNEFTVKLSKNTNDGIDVQIFDSKNTSIIQFFKLDKDAATSKFTSEVFEKINKTTQSYFFKLPNSELFLEIKNADLVGLDFDKFKEKMKDEAFFCKFFASKTEYNNSTPPTTFQEYINQKIPNTGNEASIFKSNNNFKIKKVENIIKLYLNNDEIINNIQNEANFCSEFKTYIFSSANENIFKSTFFSDEDFNKIKSTDFNITSNLTKLEEIYLKAIEKSDYSFINNYVLTHITDNITKDFAVSIKQNFNENYFLLKFCDDESKCGIAQKMPYNIDKTEFENKVTNLIQQKLLDSNYKMSEIDLALLYSKIKSFNEKKVINEKTEEDKQKLTELIEKIENLETQYSGVIKLNKTIRTYKIDPNFSTLFGLYKSFKKPVEEKSEKFVIKDAHLRFFNNKLKDVVIVGYLENNPDIEFRVLNISYSIPMRSFNNSTQYLPISPNDDDAKGLYININDVFDYDKLDSYNYSVRNKEYNINAGETIKIEERRLMDYFTAVIFSDFLGLNNNSTNALIQAEGRIKIPIWISNIKKKSIFNALSADVNATIYNGFDDSSRFIEPIEVITDGDKTSFLINNFDYIKNNNINAGINLGLFNWEWKGLYTEFNFGYGLRYFRAGLRHTIVNDGVDNVKTFQLNALSHELVANFEIRPQLNFGADLNLAFNWLNGRGATDDVTIIMNQDNNNDDKSVLRVQLNLYSKLNPDKTNDGIYARIGGFYHLGAKDFFPQILVGYATNLSTFVNKFKK